MVGVKIRVWWRECSHKDGKEDGGNSENHKMRNDIFCNALWSDKKPIDGALKPPPPPHPHHHDVTSPRGDYCALSGTFYLLGIILMAL